MAEVDLGGGAEGEQLVAVTPPGADTPAVREWIEQTARERGWTDLRWIESERDGRPVGELHAVRHHPSVP